jgi:hypothetical protein
MASTIELLDELRELTLDVEAIEGDLAAELDPTERAELQVLLHTALQRLEDWYSVDMPAKLQALEHYAAECAALSKLAKDTAAEWTATSKRRANRAGRCKEMMLALVDANGGPVVMPGGRKAHVVERKTVSVQVEDPATLPPGYRVASYRADKKALATALGAGQTVQGVSLVENVSRWVSVKDK